MRFFFNISLFYKAGGSGSVESGQFCEKNYISPKVFGSVSSEMHFHLGVQGVRETVEQ